MQNNKIFISLASYQDPMLLFTLNDAVARASAPELLRFGVVDQNISDQRGIIGELPFSRHVRYTHLHPQDTLGVSWARNLVFSLYDGEDYLLQIDSHTCFEPGWDNELREQYARLLDQSGRPIISTYPYAFEMVRGTPRYMRYEAKTVVVLRPHTESTLSENNVVLRFSGRHQFSEVHVPGCHLAAGFIFCSGRFIEDVPYDPYLYFHGEEQSLSVRAYTRGWDIFHPANVPLYHLYKPENTPLTTHHWHGDIDTQRSFHSRYLLERSSARLYALFCGSGLSGAYGLGTIRSLDSFIEFSGIDYKTKVIRTPAEGTLF